MATILDTSIVSFLTPVFIFLFLFAIFFALIKRFKIFGDKSENLAAIASFSLALLIVLSTPARDVVQTMTPMVVVFFLFVFLIFLFFLFLGVKDEDLVKHVVKSPGFYSIIIIAFIIIFLISITKAFGPIFQVTGQTGFWESTKRVIFSPRVLGGVFLLAVAAYTVRYLGSTK